MRRLIAIALLAGSAAAQADTEYRFTFTHDCSTGSAFCDPALTYSGRIVIAGAPGTGTVSGADLLRLDFFLNDPFPAQFNLQSESFGYVPSVTFAGGNVTGIDYRAFAYGDPTDPFHWRAGWFTATGMTLSYGNLYQYVITNITAVSPVPEVPEPSTYALWLLGLMALPGCRRFVQGRSARQ